MLCFQSQKAENLCWQAAVLCGMGNKPGHVTLQVDTDKSKW